MSVAQSVPFFHPSRVRAIAGFDSAQLLVLQQQPYTLYADRTVACMGRLKCWFVNCCLANIKSTDCTLAVAFLINHVFISD